MSLLTGSVTLAALFPLFSVLYLLIARGGRQLGLAVVHASCRPAAMVPGGGFGNAIVGTIVMVAIAAALSVPVGILAAIFIAEFGPDTRTATAVRFAAKVLTGLPSILAGVFAYAAVVITTGGFSAPAGGVALAILMLPTVLLTAEEAIKRVPPKMREAAIGMGATPTQVVLGDRLPTALPGILTGVMLAVARAAGETAPLLFTALFSDYWISHSLAGVPAQVARRPDEADGVARRADLQLLGLAVRQPDRARVGGRPGARRPRPGRQPRRAGARPARRGNTIEETDHVSPRPHRRRMATVRERRTATAPLRPRVIDCKIDELYYGKFKAVRDVDIADQEGHASRPSSARRAAARAPRCAASTA